MRRAFLVLVVSSGCWAAAACGSGSRDETQTAARRAEAFTPSARPTATAPVDLSRVTDAPADAYAGRTYFRDADDTTHVYWFDGGSPNSWTYRPSYRDGERTYVLEDDGTSLQRVWFDDRRAGTFDPHADPRWSAEQREALRAAARSEWALREARESDWRTRWERQNARASSDATPREVPSSRPAGEPDLGQVADVGPESYPQRTYFLDPADARHVYWFDRSNPSAWTYRPYYRDGDRVYLLERDASGLKRIFFDADAASRFDVNQDASWNVTQRGNLRTAARAEWKKRQFDESGWRSRWERHAAAEPRPRPTDSPGTRGDDVDIEKVADVGPETYPSRTYFYDRADTGYVYWFDQSDVDAWSYRPVYRDGDRAYLLDREGNGLRRVFFDDRKAREFDPAKEARWSDQQREQMRKAARDGWAQREPGESVWRSRWNQRRGQPR